jgi:hypothetical protein
MHNRILINNILIIIIHYNEEYINKSANTKFLGLQTDSYQNWTMYVCHAEKVSKLCG